jgi:16S rRNA (guanine527-N7)-methyltransferase
VNEQVKAKLLGGAYLMGFPLTSAQVGKFHRFADELAKWGKKINLTAIRDPEEVVIKHFLDSLTLLMAVGVRGALLDIGSGAGFPAIPVQIACHTLHVTSVDAVEKKIIFQRNVARLLELHGFEAIHSRAEELAGRFGGHFNWIASRAFSDIPTFARIALPLLAGQGKIVAMKGKGGREEAEAAARPLAALGLAVVEVREFDLPYSGDKRSIVVIERSPSP